MQRIKTVRWPVRNIGGDRCRAKLRYVIGELFQIPIGASQATRNVCFNVGAATAASALQAVTINGVFGDTPNLSTLGSLYQNYRIRAIKLKHTFYNTSTTYVPLVAFSVAQPDQDSIVDSDSSPNVAFPTASITTMPEQRWCKYRVIKNAATGASPTTLSYYYSLNKIYGPDSIVKNDEFFVGALQPTSPYWTTSATLRPQRGAYLQYGIFTMSGAVLAGATQDITMKTEATVYAEFFGRRPSTS